MSSQVLAEHERNYYAELIGVNSFAGLRVLDLACGTQHYSPGDGDDWSPRFALLCAQD